MILKTLTWNIGGGKLLQEGADPSLMASYTVDGLASVIDVIKHANPDIIALQETQKSTEIDQIKTIAEALGFSYYVHDTTSTSHLDVGSELGHGIISRFPITLHETGFFYNPNLNVTWEDGSIATTFDKGFTNCLIDLGNIQIQASTLHLTPFKRFNIALDSEIGKRMLADVEDKVATSSQLYLLQGDFNINSKSLQDHLPRMFEDGVYEVITNEPTTPKDNTYDHVLFKGMQNTSYSVNTNVLTDHYPIAATFEIS